MRLSLFSTRKPKPFEYKPRYYDEEKEKQEKRRKEIEASDHKDSRFASGDLKRQWLRKDRKRNQKSQSINFLVYFIIIAILVYIIFF